MDNQLDYKQRLAVVTDAAAISGLVNAAYSKWVPFIGRNPLPMDVDYNAAVLAHRFDLLHKGEALAALMETYETGDCLFLENLCVSPDFQRQGLGIKLLAQAEDIARAAGCGLIRLDTNKLFTGNVELYLRTGYDVDWEKPVNGGVHVRMSKRIF